MPTNEVNDVYSQTQCQWKPKQKETDYKLHHLVMYFVNAPIHSPVAHGARAHWTVRGTFLAKLLSIMSTAVTLTVFLERFYACMVVVISLERGEVYALTCSLDKMTRRFSLIEFPFLFSL